MGNHFSKCFRKRDSLKDNPHTSKESYLSQPDKHPTAKCYQHGSLTIAIAAMRGWREYMEDAHAISSDEDGKAPLLAGVYDGHNGVAVASHCSEHLLASIQSHEAFLKGEYERCFQEVFVSTDARLKELATPAGSTAVIALVTDTKLIVANCGDSRCILSTRNNDSQHVAMSFDHKPNLRAERRRIIKADGIIDDTDPNCHRVVSRLTLMAMATSRALGDFDFKDADHLAPEHQMVTCVPDVIVRPRESADRFLILASDGVWDVFTNSEITSYIDDMIILEGIEDVGEISKRLLEKCFLKGSSDNMTIIIIDLRSSEMKTQDVSIKVDCATKDLDGDPRQSQPVVPTPM